jgi:hypothetical protein
MNNIYMRYTDDVCLAYLLEIIAITQFENLSPRTPDTVY